MMLSNKAFFLIQSCLKYFPFKLGIKLRRILYPTFFKKFGKAIVIHDNVLFKYPSDIELGDNITFNQGNYVVGKGGLLIGSDVMIGAGTKITTTTHNFSSVDLPMNQQGISFNKIEIGNDVWFGFDVKVLAGATIGNGSICATSTVITAIDIPSYSVVAGVPAKIKSNRKKNNAEKLVSNDSKNKY